MVKTFRITAILEGISYLLLFAVGMPLKYWGEVPEPNQYIGYTHGFLFISYVLLAVIVCYRKKWGVRPFVYLFLASLLPFGTFYIDQKYLRYLN